MELNNELKKQIIKDIEYANSFNDVTKILKDYDKYELKGAILGRAFEKMYISKDGFSKDIKMDELERLHHSFHTTNGGDWCRSNQSYLGKIYNIDRKLKGSRIAEVRADGFNKQTIINQSIRTDILEVVQKKNCLILDIGTNIECDHKDGMKDNWKLNDKSMQQIDDFQPLSKTANDAKRQHCIRCKKTGKRYDAKNLGYSESYIFGRENSKVCNGCYWYDPIEFNRVISENFKKIDK